MKLIELNLTNSKVMMVQFAPNTADPKEHTHGSDFQLSIPLAGTPYIRYQQEARRLEEDLWCITAPGEKHYHFANDCAAKVLLINFEQAFLQQVLADRLEQSALQVEFMPWIGGPAEGLRKMALNLMRLAMEGDGDQAPLQELEYELASLLFALGKGSHTEGLQRRAPRLEHPALQRVLHHIHEDLSLDLRLDVLAQEAGISKYYLIRLFREYLGQTPSAYIADVRLSTAKQKLFETNADITQIAYDVGFGSLDTFERLFKQKHQMSPSEFRKLR